MPWAREWILAAALLTTACPNGDEGEGKQGGAESSSSGQVDAESSGDSTSGTDGGTTTDATYATLEERPCPPESALTWENFGGGYVLTYCTTCHHSALPADTRQLAPLAVNLETVELVRGQAPRVWARAADQNQTMPPVGAPHADQRELLGEWLACGAPTNADLGMQ